MNHTSNAPATLYVDGENLSRIDVASMVNRFPEAARRIIYQTEAAARKQGYPGYEHQIVPHIGKESVDKSIAMDIVDAYHHGERAVIIASNDRDFGATALHLKSRYPDMAITIACDPARVHLPYLRSLAKKGVCVEHLWDSPELDDFACKVIEVICELEAGGKLTLARLGVELRNRGIEYVDLKKTLVRRGVITAASTDEAITMTESAKAKRFPAKGPES